MSEEPYLILHKVRGEPTFDIAIKLQIGDEEGWIIPTSGHRAYPFRHWELSSLADIDDINNLGCHTRPWAQDDIPPDWPDHYATKAIDDRPKFTLESLGLTKVKPAERLKRP